MLFDPKWKQPEPETKAGPYNLPGLIAWLEQQQPEQTYCFMNYEGECLLDQYVTAMTGEPSRPTAITHWGTCGGPRNYNFIAASHPMTFGAALKRARKIAGQQS